MRHAATEHRLFPEQVGLGLLAEIGLDHTGPPAAQRSGVGQRVLLGMAGGVVVDRHQTGNPVPELELAAHGVARSLGSDHRYVDGRFGLDLAEVDVETVGEHQRLAYAQVGGDRVAVDLSLQMVGDQHHHHVRPGRCVGGRQHANARVLGLCDAGTVRAQPDGDFHSRIAQVVGVREPLAAVADDGDPGAVYPAQIDVGVVVDLQCAPPWATPGRSVSMTERIIGSAPPKATPGSLSDCRVSGNHRRRPAGRFHAAAERV